MATISIMKTHDKPTYRIRQYNNVYDRFIIELGDNVHLHCSKEELFALRNHINSFTIELEQGKEVEKL